MKILHVITSLYTGGAERLMVDLLPLLQDDGRNQVDLLLINGVETPLKKMIQEIGIKVYALSSTNDVYNPRNILRLRHFLAHENYDIIHTHNTACQVYVPIAKELISSNVTLVTTEHNTTGRRRTKKWFKPIDQWVYRQYAAIVCISDQARDNLVQHIDRENGILTIYNGIDTNRFIRPIKDITGQKEFVITMVAGFRPQKDQNTLLRAMTILPENYRMQFVGSGERENEIKGLCSKMGLNDRVSFMGLRSDVPDILAQSDVVVLSSHWEGLSLSSIEGMSSGCPFVASDVDGLREIVSGAGMLFPEGDEKALADMVQRLCENPDLYRKIAIACQERSKQFDISVMAEGYHQLYQSLMEGK